jgi:hypothetical protein
MAACAARQKLLTAHPERAEFAHGGQFRPRFMYREPAGDENTCGA